MAASLVAEHGAVVQQVSSVVHTAVLVCGISPDQGSKLGFLHWQVNSYPTVPPGNSGGNAHFLRIKKGNPLKYIETWLAYSKHHG